MRILGDSDISVTTASDENLNKIIQVSFYLFRNFILLNLVIFLTLKINHKSLKYTPHVERIMYEVFRAFKVCYFPLLNLSLK